MRSAFHNHCISADCLHPRGENNRAMKVDIRPDTQDVIHLTSYKTSEAALSLPPALQRSVSLKRECGRGQD